MKLLFQKSLPQSTLSKMEEIGLFMNFLFFVIFWHRKKLLNFFSFSEDEQNSETIDPKKIYFDEKNKVWLWEVDGHLFTDQDFHTKQGGKIEDFENWIKDNEKEPIDSIESVISKKLN